MRAIKIIFPALLLALPLAEANAAELKLLCAGALRSAITQLTPELEKASGEKVKVDFATAGKAEEKIAADEDYDVVILTKPRIDKLVTAAKVAGGSLAPLAKAQIGLAVKKGAKKPDIGTVEALKKTLLAAKSIAIIDPASGGTSGIHLAKELEKLGIATELKPKLKLIKPPPGQNAARAAEAVAKGEAEIAMQPISELMEVPGIEVVGPLPAELQTPELTYLAGSPATTEQPLAAKKLIEFLASAPAAAVYKAKGLTPG